MEPSETLIVFDWDDTLLCSSAINHQNWTPAQMQELQQLVVDVLETALRLGEVMIITNGNEHWVEESTKLFFPGLQPLLDRTSVYSARAAWGRRFPGDAFAWKRAAFREILAARRGEWNSPSGFSTANIFLGCGRASTISSPSSGNGGINLVVLGDSRAEMEAAEHSRNVLGRCSLVKTVKFKEMPTVYELLGQLRKLSQELGGIVFEDQNSSRSLMMQPLANVGQLASWASGWKLSVNSRPWRTPRPRAQKPSFDAVTNMAGSIAVSCR